MHPLWQWDQGLFRQIHVGLHRDWLDPFFVAITFTGLGYAQIAWLLLANFRTRMKPSFFLGLAMAGLVLVPFVEHSWVGLLSGVLGFALCLTLERRVAACAVAAVVSSGVFRILVAKTVERERPSNLSFAAPLEHVYGSTSFPSGHATTTFAIAAVACWAYAKTENAWVAWSLAAWSALVAMSRVYVGVHYPLDVISAGFLGAAFGSVCYLVWKERGWLTSEESADHA